MTEQPNMIERAARAMHEADALESADVTGFGSIWGWDDAHPDVRTRYLRLARVCAETWMEPTPGMLDQGVAKLESAPYVSPYAVWQAMLSAALNEGKGE